MLECHEFVVHEGEDIARGTKIKWYILTRVYNKLGNLQIYQTTSLGHMANRHAVTVISTANDHGSLHKCYAAHTVSFLSVSSSGSNRVQQVV